MDAPTLTLKVIKRILEDENSKRLDNQRVHDALDKDFALALKWMLDEKIKSIASYEDADQFVREFYRMSLQEWAESL